MTRRKYRPVIFDFKVFDFFRQCDILNLTSVIIKTQCFFHKALYTMKIAEKNIVV